MRRSTALGVALLFLAMPNVGVARPLQEGTPENDRTESDATEVEIDIDIEVTLENAGQLATTLEDLHENVSTQLKYYEAAEKAVDDAVQKLADINSTIVNAELWIEELTVQSDEVVTAAFVNPPAAGALDLMTTESVTDLAVKQKLLQVQTDEDGTVLKDLATARSDLKDGLEIQREREQEAVNARDDATEALADLDGALSQQTKFLLQVQSMMDDGVEGGIPEEFTADFEALNAQLAVIEEATAEERARRAIEEQAKREAESGAFICPVRGGGLNFTDTWGAARSGGRTHAGTDMMASNGTPTVAPVSGRVEHRTAGLGGQSWYVYDDNGDTHFGAHLSAYENVGVGRVEAGDVIGYVGSSGNAQSNAPHLHFEFKPGGGASVNPYSKLRAACL